ncbi:histone-lysine N-methyltransferase SMYD3-like [Lytechinus variegatus]|uniref:histone-lysine N-methyltransferase SMYD3-like n=1 Tax=Lytechinus variegatus TaxID=7654 RepID=UPI001BB243E4|nr:histone-lysine N-methyltransferase SMYD3-like [Lytechinus variegatus]
MAESAIERAIERAIETVRVIKSAFGRKLVFASEFSTRKCILEEYPYFYILCNKKRGLFCDFCLKQRSDLQRCSSCKYVRYCSRQCQKADWSRCHKQDCKTLKRIHPRVPPDLAQLLSQIIRRQNKPPPLDDEDHFPTSLDQLESHHDKLSDARKDHFQSLLFVLNQCMDGAVLPEPSSLLKMFGAIICNSFSICDNDLNGIAVGIYLRASMLNHSCNPNCLVVFDGRKLQLRTVKDVKEGEECTISYVDIMDPVKERQSELEERYHFTCNCVKCVDEIKSSEPGDGLDERVEGLKKSLETIQDAEKSQDWCKVLLLCEPYLKPMDTSQGLPANHHLLVKLRDKAFDACIDTQAWEKAAMVGKLNTEPYRHHYGPYHPSLGIHLLKMGKLLLYLERLQEARKYLTEAENVLEVTHGPQHTLMLTLVQELLCSCR